MIEFSFDETNPKMLRDKVNEIADHMIKKNHTNKTIERELLGIGQAEMQNIVFEIIDKQYAPTNIVNLGSASGVQTTRYGTPDVFLTNR